MQALNRAAHAAAPPARPGIAQLPALVLHRARPAHCSGVQVRRRGVAGAGRYCRALLASARTHKHTAPSPLLMTPVLTLFPSSPDHLSPCPSNTHKHKTFSSPTLPRPPPPRLLLAAARTTSRPAPKRTPPPPLPTLPTTAASAPSPTPSPAPSAPTTTPTSRASP